MRWLRARLGQVDGERGSALVEFVFIALVVFVPLVYIVADFSAVQRGVFAATAGAREAGRAMGTAPDPATGQEQALRAAQLAVEDQSVEATDVRVEYAPADSDCDATGADWMAEAVEAAEDYLEFSSFSRQGLIDQLTSQYGSQFTRAEAEYAVDSVGL